jgi:hypothetical protein
MKPFLFFAGLLLGHTLFAEQIVVFAKGDFVVLDSTKPAPAPTVPAKSAFLATVKADLTHPAAFAAPFALSAPPEWGKTVPGASGKIEFHDKFRGGFFVHVTLEGLAPDHRYILTLNGNPKLAGNDRLVDAVPGLATERYFDFLTATTDEHGSYQATFAIALLAGPYDVRFYVKDTDDFKIVLYHDYFKFTVE